MKNLILILIGMINAVIFATPVLSYDGSVLTIDGSDGTAMTWEDVYDSADWAGGIGGGDPANSDLIEEVVAGAVYRIKCDVIFGADNSQACVFRSMNEYVYFDDDCEFTIYGDTNDSTTLQLGNGEGASYGINTTHWSVGPNASTTIMDSSDSNMQFYLYGSTLEIRDDQRLLFNGATNSTIRFYNAMIIGNGDGAANAYMQFVQAIDCQQTTFSNMQGIVFYVSPTTFSDVTMVAMYLPFTAQCEMRTDSLLMVRETSRKATVNNGGNWHIYNYRGDEDTDIDGDILLSSNTDCFVKTWYDNAIQIIDKDGDPVTGAVVEHYWKHEDDSGWTYDGQYITDSDGMTSEISLEGRIWQTTDEVRTVYYHRFVATHSSISTIALDNYEVIGDGVVALKENESNYTVSKP